MIKRAYECVKSSFANLVGKKAMMKNTCTSRFAAIPFALLAMIIWLVPSVLIANDNAANVSITPSPIYVFVGQVASATATVTPADQYGTVTFKMDEDKTGKATVTPGTATAGVTTLIITGVKVGTTNLKGFVNGVEKTSVVVIVSPPGPYLTGELIPKVLYPTTNAQIAIGPRPDINITVSGQGEWSLQLKDANNNPVTVTTNVKIVLYGPSGTPAGSINVKAQKIMSLAVQTWVSTMPFQAAVTAQAAATGPYIASAEQFVTIIGATNRVDPKTAQQPFSILVR